jgi:hypothetical protein
MVSNKIFTIRFFKHSKVEMCNATKVQYNTLDSDKACV